MDDLVLKTVVMRNFMSVGNVPQTVDLTKSFLTLVLGENLDIGSGGSRNGVGKSTVLQAICFALYGDALTAIKKDNLVNKTNKKNAYVELTFERNGCKYKIERGRKPAFLKWYVNDSLVKVPNSNEALGESKWTQREIEKVYGMSLLLHRHIGALNTKTVPFLSEKAGTQREIIEELLGITALSERAEKIAAELKKTKEAVRDEEVRIKTITESNERINNTIKDLQLKSMSWNQINEQSISELKGAIEQLTSIDIAVEIELHKKKAIYKSKLTNLLSMDDKCNQLEREKNRLQASVQAKLEELTKIESHECPTCGTEVHDERMDNLKIEIEEYLIKSADELQSLDFNIKELTESMQDLAAELGDEPSTMYDDISDAHEHQNTLSQLQFELNRKQTSTNPYIEQIANLSESGLSNIDYTYHTEITRLRDHQDFMVKLLTNKDSFIRKQIIDDNLSYLNKRLAHYLSQLMLPHSVKFMNDLSVEITELGEDFDFESLSGGEGNRLVLALSWAFRDVWEDLNHPINMMAIDELVDSGMDPQGMESALDILKNMGLKRKKNIFLISHKDELLGRINSVLLVQKEGGYTKYDQV